ncbi:MAG: hypothetical protein MUP17_02255 [candidate division Zixibacteria bacterium]|nr:hypothetical protein [candidate division Zixibacteria bacterium]
MNESNSLFKVTEEEYGQDYKKHLFAQYKIYVESMDRISDRRQNANNYFITINTILISFMGVLFQIKIFESIMWLKSLVTFVGVIICIIFWFLLRSYKQLNKGKFRVIHEIEKKLPIALYDYEWKILEEGKNKRVYYPFSHIEMIIPWVFGIVYIVLGVLFFKCS